eukprot:9326177-Pyramimonas_sp.AAC.1
MGPRTAVLGGRKACGHRHWGKHMRCSSRWVHETQHWVGNHMLTPRLGPSMELAMGPRSAVLGEGDACGRRHWGR